MTDYCDSDDITANLRGVTFGASSVVTSSALADIISQESAVIDQHLRGRYTLPVSDATALLWLKKIAIDLVVYRVSKILQPKNPAPVPENATQEISHSTAYREAMKMLRNILDGKMSLPGETEKSVSFFKSSAVDSSEPMAIDLVDADGNDDVRLEIW